MKRLATLLVIVAVLASFVAACAAPTPEVIEKEVVVEKPVIQTVVIEKEVVVEKEVPVTVEVEKEVVVEKEVPVTVEVMVEPTPIPEPKTLRIVKMEPNVGLDPAIASTALSLAPMSLMHDVLVEFDENWQPLPWVAESWETNDDKSEWAFHIRDGLAFSDGSPITGEDVKFSFEYLAKGVVFEGRLSVVESIELPDPMTVVLKMSRPVPEFLQLPASHIGWWIVSKAACSGGKCGDFTVPGIATSGPWYLEEYILKDHMTLERNPYYGFEGLPKFDRVLFTWTGDRTAAVAAIEAGQADFTQPVNAPDAGRLEASPDVGFFTAARVDQFRGWGIDKEIPPFNDKLVRQAFGYAMEPDEITETCWFGYASSLFGGLFYEEDIEWFPLLGREPWKGKTREERLAIADELLTEAGWEDRDGDGIRESYGVEGLEDRTPLSVVAVYEKPWVQSECHALLTQDYVKDIGFDLQLQGLPKTNYWPDVRAGKQHMWHVGSGTSPLPWLKLYEFFHSKGSRFSAVVRLYGPESEKLDADIDAMLEEQDLEKRKQMMSDLVDYLLDEQFVIATGSQNSLVAGNPDLEGFYTQWNVSMRALIWSDIPGR